MKNKIKLLCIAIATTATISAQRAVEIENYTQMYPTENGKWYQYWDTWEPGKLTADDNFFISRVRPQNRFTNPKSQINPEIDATGRKILWWMPISNGSTEFSLNLPQYQMRNDNFNFWQYIDTHGGWNQGLLRSSGTFGDVCHKNGVKNSVVMFFDQIGSMIDYTKPNQNEPSKIFSIWFKQDGEGKFVEVPKLIKLMKYYGISGLSINPESSMSQETAYKFQDFMVACREEAEKQGWGDQWFVAWYDAMNNNGSGYSWGMNALTSDRLDWFRHRSNGKKVVDHFFLNYNNNDGSIRQSSTAATNLGRSPYEVYVGQHIGGRGLGTAWESVFKYPISIGTWGEHSQNNIFYNSTDKGSAPKTVSTTYVEKLEMFFSGGNRNPLKTPKFIEDRADLSYANCQRFHGMAVGVAAQSTLNKLPFVTYFSLGNGEKNSEKGRIFNHFQWYNLGMQDMMPTWRWWISNDANIVPSDAINCEFSFDEAYIGGNSIKLSGATVKSNIRLYKTAFAVGGNEDASFTFKVKNGIDPKINIIYSLVGSENQFKSVPVSQAQTSDQWTTATWKLKDWGVKNGDVIATIGLSVANSASNYEVYVGGISIVDPAKRYFPVKPVLRPEVTRYRGAYNYESFKLIWDSKINADKWEVVYNDEVDTWYFEVMISEDGKEPTIANRTTSWGAMTVAEVNPSCKNIRVGVRAVAPDGITRSDIAWATNSYEHKYEYQKGIVYESRKLVADEEFTVSLEDPTIPTAHWRLLDENKSVLKEDDGTSFTTSCKNVGLYSIEVSFVDPTPENLNNEYKKLYDGLIQVTPSETGRFPKADFIPSIESVDITDGPKDVTFTFNGIKGEGFASQAVNLSDGTHFFAFDPNIIRKPNTLTMAAWVKSTESIGQVMSLRELGGNPSWGSTWVYIEKNNFTLMGRDRGQDFKDMNSGVEAKIGVWYHIAFTLDRDNKKVCFYINGKKTNEQNVSFKSSYDLYSLGTEGFQGAIDEVQLWDRALTPEEVKVAMYGYKSPNIPANLKGYWVFEETLASNAKKFPNLGTAGDAYPGGCFKGTSLGDKDNLMPKIVGGSSWLSGTLPLKATLKWNFPGATKVNESNPESPVVTYSKEGSYETSLTVTNAWGSSSKKIKVTVLNGTSIINDASTKIVTVFPLPFNDNFNVNVIESGKYTVNVYNETGMLVKKQTQDCVDNECISVDLNAPVGTYMIRILKNNVEVEAVKAVKLK